MSDEESAMSGPKRAMRCSKCTNSGPKRATSRSKRAMSGSKCTNRGPKCATSRSKRATSDPKRATSCSKGLRAAQNTQRAAQPLVHSSFHRVPPPPLFTLRVLQGLAATGLAVDERRVSLPTISKLQPSATPLLPLTATPPPSDLTSREYRATKFTEDHALVPYDKPLTIFTNYGVGGRFLTRDRGPIESNCNVTWQMPFDSASGIELWVIRRFKERTAQSATADSHFVDDLGRVEPYVRCGDIVLVESFSFPGYYIKPVKGVNTVVMGQANAAIQIAAPSLRFAIKLGERTSMYRAAALSSRNAKMQGQERRERIKSKIITTKIELELRTNINHVLPVEVVCHILSFFQGCGVRGEVKAGLWGVGASDTEVKSPYECQLEIDTRPISMRKEHVKYLRRAREVCTFWDELASPFMCGLKAGEMLESGRGLRRHLETRVMKFCNVTSLNLRNMDSLLDSDVKALCGITSKLRVLNMGGCLKVTDEGIDYVCEAFKVRRAKQAVRQEQPDARAHTHRCAACSSAIVLVTRRGKLSPPPH